MIPIRKVLAIALAAALIYSFIASSSIAHHDDHHGRTQWSMPDCCTVPHEATPLSPTPHTCLRVYTSTQQQQEAHMLRTAAGHIYMLYYSRSYNAPHRTGRECTTNVVTVPIETKATLLNPWPAYQQQKVHMGLHCCCPHATCCSCSRV